MLMSKRTVVTLGHDDESIIIEYGRATAVITAARRGNEADGTPMLFVTAGPNLAMLDEDTHEIQSITIEP